MKLELHKLGWQSFQQMCTSILKEILGQTIEHYLDSHDAGVDGAFQGTWKQSKNENFTGKFVFQCKFTQQADHRSSLSDLKDEISKAKKLVSENRCDIYVLITNAGVSGVMRGRLEKALTAAGVKQILILGYNWICDTVRDNKSLRMLIPRVYGLGDLSQILDERVYAQARELLYSLKDDLSKVVITQSYLKAAEAINKHGFVLLIGEPAAGKTTIASLLAIGALDQWKLSTMKLDDADKVIKHWNPDDPTQFFWIDDAFGVTQYESYLALSWNHKFSQIKAMLNQGVKFVLTSRDYIYRGARRDLKEGAFPLLNESQVVIDVHSLSIAEKSQILYNHVKLGNQTNQFRKQIKPFLQSIAERESFVPETARRLGEPSFTKDLILHEYWINNFVDKQEEFLIEVIESLDNSSKAALSLIYMRNNNLNSPIQLDENEIDALDRLGSNIGDCTYALTAMRHGMVHYRNDGDSSSWSFKHPTIGDAFGNILRANPELLGIYVSGIPLIQLMNQITCGDMGIENAVIIPEALFQRVNHRLKDFSKTNNYKNEYLSAWDTKYRLFNFLARRCSKSFLKLYIKSNSSLFDNISNPTLYLDSASEINLSHRLYSLGLLPESTRKQIVEVLSKYALSGEDLYALKGNRIQEIFTSEEFESLKQEVRDTVFPELKKMTKDLKEEYKNSRNDAETHMEIHLDNLDCLFRLFEEELDKEKDCTDIIQEIDAEIVDVRFWVDESKDDYENFDDREKLKTSQDTEEYSKERSIFDDIDS